MDYFQHGHDVIEAIQPQHQIRTPKLFLQLGWHENRCSFPQPMACTPQKTP